MDTEELDWLFEDWVREALDTLPRDFRDRLRNVQVVIQQEPSREQLALVGVRAPFTLFGLYQGVPLTVRNGGQPLFPDSIILFRGPLTRSFADEAAMKQQVQHTVRHEIAHYFGISDARLHELDAY